MSDRSGNRQLLIAIVVAAICAPPGCASRKQVVASDWDGGLGPNPHDGGGPYRARYLFDPRPRKGVDILFVVDNSQKMKEKQTNLIRSFPGLMDALRCPALGGGIPDLHIGVISTDLGSGPFQLPSCEVIGGAKGKLQAQPMLPGCDAPTDPFISYTGGKTNVVSASTDPVDQIIKAFGCVAPLGDEGCNFEQTLEATRRALDPKLNINPGFIRAKENSLAVVLVTDEDDCSAQKPQLYDPNQTQINSPLGPLTSFRCFKFGFRYDCPGQKDCQWKTTPTGVLTGVMTNCKPAYDWLHEIEGYISFFASMKPQGWLTVHAIAGPAQPVEVYLDQSLPSLKPSCTSSLGGGVPALRIKALVDGIRNTGNRGYFNVGVELDGRKVPISICSTDYTPALRLLGRSLCSGMTGWCIAAPLTAEGSLACHKGDRLGPNTTCQVSCLDRADCLVALIKNRGTTSETRVSLPRCAAAKFDDPQDRDCGSTCPCWRIVPQPTCQAEVDGSPYGLDILFGKTAPTTGIEVEAKCVVSGARWGSSQLASMSQCKM